MRHLFSYLLTRLLLAIPMVFILLTIIFVVLRVMPGDPVSAMLGDRAPLRVIEQKKRDLGLDKPITIQYVNYLGQLARFDLGNSMIFQQRVSSAIGDKLPATIELTLFGLLASLAIGIPLGAAAARRRRSSGDFGIRLYANVVYCIPVFWMGLLLQLLFGVLLGWFPISGRTSPRMEVSAFSWSGFYTVDTLRIGNLAAFGDVMWHLVLPALTLGVVLSGIFVRLTRANMLDVLKSDYILAARARGIPERRVVYNHGLRNALIPDRDDAWACSSASSWRGPSSRRARSPGRAWAGCSWSASTCATIPSSRVSSSCYALLVSAISLLVDLLYAAIDPRVKY